MSIKKTIKNVALARGRVAESRELTWSVGISAALSLIIAAILFSMATCNTSDSTGLCGNSSNNAFWLMFVLVAMFGMTWGIIAVLTWGVVMGTMYVTKSLIRWALSEEGR